MDLMTQLYSLIRAVAFVAIHPFDIVHLTVVRRYADAQGHFIGELYEGSSRDARMIGASCDNWPLDADVKALPPHPSVCFSKSFLEPLSANTLRVGALEPQDNARVQAYIATRRFCVLRFTVLNRFIETILEGHNVR